MITAESLRRYDRHGVTVDEDGRYWIGRGSRRKRIGAQAPTFCRLGEYHHSLGSEVAAIFRGWGTSFYPCQEDELELFLARDENNEVACIEICISKPRQNGKSFGARKYAIWMAAGENKHVLYSAHNGSTVRKMFRFIRDEVLNTPDLAEGLKKDGNPIVESKGMEAIYFEDGGCIEFQTRTSSGALGTTYDVIIVDEAQQLTDDQMDAIKPTQIASDSGDPQMIYIGTPPKPTEPGEVFQDQHDRAHDLATPCSIWWLEWSVPDIPDMADEDAVLELAWRCDPAMGLRIRPKVMQSAIRSYRYKGDRFARQYLGWWSPVVNTGPKSIVSREKWDSLEVESAPESWQKLAYGVRFTRDGENVALAVCVLTEKGAHVEFIREKSTSVGVGWLVDWISERRGKMAAVGIDGKADATDLRDQLIAAKVAKPAVMVMSAADAMSSCGMLVNAINGRTLTHVAQDSLAVAATSATRRKIGNGGGYGFDGDLVERFEACGCAMWAARTTKRNPQRKAVVR